MESTSTQKPDAGQYRVVVNSIGKAGLAASAAIAKGLGIPASTLVARLYRAPAVLVEGVEQQVADQVSKLLCDIGYQSEVQDISLPAPARSKLYDVAVYVHEAEAFLPTVKMLSQFIGITESDASSMLMTPPGIVLGSVSKATVEVLHNQLNDGASIIASITDQANYDLFLGDGVEIVRRRILADIQDAKIPLIAEQGLVAAGVDHEAAQSLWRRHQASGLMRIVNRDFLRFDLVCTGIAEGYGKASVEQIALLNTLAGIPKEMVTEVLDALPLTLLDAVPNAEVEQKMMMLEQVGLQMQADLVSFQLLDLEVLSITQPSATANTLINYGLHQQGQSLPALPFKLGGSLPELQAKLIKAALEQSGAKVVYAESQT